MRRSDFPSYEDFCPNIALEFQTLLWNADEWDEQLKIIGKSVGGISENQLPIRNSGKSLVVEDLISQEIIKNFHFFQIIQRTMENKVVINEKLMEFPQEVIKEIGYYVYRLIDPRNGETFYVGRGKGNRVFQHVRGVLKEIKERNDEGDDEETLKLKTIREIYSSGLEVIHVIHRHGLDKETVKEVEAALIDAYPFSANIIAGVGGDDYGPMNTTQIIQKYKADEAEIKHKVVMITINRSVYERDIYNAVRFCWRMSKQKADQAELVLPVERGIILDVYIPYEWKPATIENFPELGIDVPGRLGFYGIRADDDILSMYVGKKIPSEYRLKGAANPVKYNY